MAKPRGNPEFGKSITPGRKKGIPNKTTQWLKTELMRPFDADEFAKWAKANPTQYFSNIVAKFIPKDVNLGGSVEFLFKGFAKNVDNSGSDPI
jgi:hypothetical protein